VPERCEDSAPVFFLSPSSLDFGVSFFLSLHLSQLSLGYSSFLLCCALFCTAKYAISGKTQLGNVEEDFTPEEGFDVDEDDDDTKEIYTEEMDTATLFSAARGASATPTVAATLTPTPTKRSYRSLHLLVYS